MENFFKKRFENFEAEPDPKLWDSLSPKLSLPLRKRRFLPLVFILALLQLPNQSKQTKQFVSHLPLLFQQQNLVKNIPIKKVQFYDFQIFNMKVAETLPLKTNVTNINQSSNYQNFNIVKATNTEFLIDNPSKLSNFSIDSSNLINKNLVINILDSFHIPLKRSLSLDSNNSKSINKVSFGFSFTPNFTSLAMESRNYQYEPSTTKQNHRSLANKLGFTAKAFVNWNLNRSIKVGLHSQFLYLRGSFFYTDFDDPSNFSVNSQNDILFFSPRETAKDFTLLGFSQGVFATYRLGKQFDFTLSTQFILTNQGFKGLGNEFILSKRLLQSHNFRVDAVTSLTIFHEKLRLEIPSISVQPYQIGIGLSYQRFR
jgi:hypothetical protein